MATSDKYIFESFIQSVQGLSYLETVAKANAALEDADAKMLDGTKINPALALFSARVQDLLNFLKRGVVTTKFRKDALLHKDIAQVLVEKKELGQDVLDRLTKAIAKL